MTDEEIVKALECCSDYQNADTCEQCPFKDKECATTERLDKYALDLIKRKDAEIDILIRKKETLRDEIVDLQAQVEMLKKEIITLVKYGDDTGECRIFKCSVCGVKVGDDND